MVVAMVVRAISRKTPGQLVFSPRRGILNFMFMLIYTSNTRFVEEHFAVSVVFDASVAFVRTQRYNGFWNKRTIYALKV